MNEGLVLGGAMERPDVPFRSSRLGFDPAVGVRVRGGACSILLQLGCTKEPVASSGRRQAFMPVQRVDGDPEALRPRLPSFGKPHRRGFPPVSAAPASSIRNR